MRLYDDDYTKITPQERKVIETLKRKWGSEFIRPWESKDTEPEYTRRLQHYRTLFPNNLLHPDDLDKSKVAVVKRFESLLDTEPNERQVLDFVKNYNAYFMVGSIPNAEFNFGHQKLFLFPEFQLGTSHVADYVLVGRSSDGYEFVLVELESPTGSIVLRDGNFGDAIRKGLNQTRDWAEWLESNFGNLREVFNKSKSPEHELPEEFVSYDKTRIHFVVVAGRRHDFNDRTRRRAREESQSRDVCILHYDNIVGYAHDIVDKGRY
jgi:Shedu protein SduA, C-terminal